MKGLKKLYLTGIYSLYAQIKKNCVRMQKICFLNVIFMRFKARRAYLVYHCLLFLKTVETHLLLAYTDTWQTSVTTMPKLRTYNTFKSELKTEAYVKANVSNTRQRSTISKIRTGTYPLEIELGRYRGIPGENLLCKLCRCEPETEEHFLLKCTKTYDIRQTQNNVVKCSIR